MTKSNKNVTTKSNKNVTTKSNKNVTTKSNKMFTSIDLSKLMKITPAALRVRLRKHDIAKNVNTKTYSFTQSQMTKIQKQIAIA